MLREAFSGYGNVVDGKSLLDRPPINISEFLVYVVECGLSFSVVTTPKLLLFVQQL